MKSRSQYCCQSCGYISTKWLGRCPGCENWNSLVEERLGDADLQRNRSQKKNQWVLLDPLLEASLPSEKTSFQKRFSTGMGELDRVLGGGLVADSFVLLGGDPGIGKSTLLMQMAHGLRIKHPDLKILYASGEESVDQIRGRAHRLRVHGKDHIFLLSETCLENVLTTVKELKPQILVVDSLQAFSSNLLESAPGSMSQVREVAAQLMSLAKTEGMVVWLVGHVTKEGNIAGPKVVEHMVDTVLYIEAETAQTYRLLRTVKNRFGSSCELGVFEMDGEGLREVTNPSSFFLSDRKTPISGTAISAMLEGTRPLLIELQALVSSSCLALPRRTAVGFDLSRLSILAAVLEKQMKLPLAQQDLFFNVVGGLRLTEPACDLAAAAAIWSSYEEFDLPLDWLFIGEIGLTGEIRKVSQPELRIQEARKLGYQTAVIPKHSQECCSKISEGIHLIPLENISQLPKIFR